MAEWWLEPTTPNQCGQNPALFSIAVSLINPWLCRNIQTQLFRFPKCKVTDREADALAACNLLNSECVIISIAVSLATGNQCVQGALVYGSS